MFTSEFFEYFLRITCIIKSQVGEVNQDTAIGFKYYCIQNFSHHKNAEG